MRYLTLLLVLTIFVITTACSSSDPDPAINLFQHPGIDTDDRVVIDPDDFELEYRFDCEPRNCVSQCRLDADDEWFGCESPFYLDQDSPEFDIEEGYFYFEVRSYHDEDHSAPDIAETLVLYDFDFGLDDAEEYEPGAADSAFYFPDEYSATCSRDDCELSCFWEGDDFEITETDCSLEEPFELEFPDEDLDDVHLLVEACATNFGGRQGDEHCKGPQTYLFYPPPPAFVTVEAGARHTCGIVEDGSLWCWGRNNAGQLGVGTTQSEVATADKVLNRNWRMVTAGGEHTCAINDDDELYCWGDNSNNQLGFSPQNNTQAEKVDDGPWKTASAGGSHTCAIRADDGSSDSGDLLCWGSNSDGQLGNESATSDGEMYSVALPGGTENEWLDVSAGDEHTCATARRQGGGSALFCWGNQSGGRLGNNEDSGQAATPEEVLGDFVTRDADSISSSTEHTCAVGSSGGTGERAYCWGEGSAGRLGAGDDNSWPTPERVEDGDNIVHIVTGDEHSCGLHQNGTVYCWGENIRHQLGTGGSESNEPVAIDVDDGLSFTDIAAGDEHSCALDDRGFIRCWGRHDHGRLGIGEDDTGDYITAETPTEIAWPQGEFVPTPGD